MSGQEWDLEGKGDSEVTLPLLAQSWDVPWEAGKRRGIAPTGPALSGLPDLVHRVPALRSGPLTSRRALPPWGPQEVP